MLSVEYGDHQWLDRLDPKKVDDPEILRYIRLVKGTPDQTEYNRNNTLAATLKMWSEVDKFEPEKERKVLTLYPLLNDLNVYRMSNEVYFYLNAKYASRKDKK